MCATEGQVQWAWTLHQRMRRLGYRPDRPTCSALTQALCRAAVATDSGEARGMLRRAIEAFERAAVTGVAAEGEGETNAWDEDDERTSPTGMTVEQEIASMEDQSNWDAVGDWSLENDAPVALGPACPLKGEVAAAAEAKAKKGKVPPEEVLSPGAIRSLIAAAARTGELKFRAQAVSVAGGRAALKPARVRGESGNAEDGGARREVFEVMCEACCHEGLVDVALEVFDDVKAYDVRVSKVTLAFLEACCRRSKVPEWRVFDVCAQLRHQVTAKKQARLAAQMPAKSRSHHVYGVVDSADSSDEDDVDASIPPATITTSSSSSSATAAFVQDDVGGERRRRKDVEDKWERARRERSRDRARGQARIRAAGKIWTSRGSSSTIRTGTIRTGTTTRVTGGRAGRRRWIPCRLSFAPRGWEEVTGKTHRSQMEAFFFNEASKIHVLARSASKKRGFRFKQSNLSNVL